jgi:hypothetical protein
MRDSPRITRLAAAALVVCLVGSASLAAAATTASVGFGTDSARLDTDATRTFDVVVDDADGGVGAYNLTVTLADDSLGTLVSVSEPGDTSPAFRDVSYSDDRTSATLRVAGLDTPDTGSVTVATVTVETANAGGDTTLALDANALGDEAGNAYTVAGVSDLALSVGSTAEQTSTTPDGGDERSSDDGSTGPDDSSNASGADADSDTSADRSNGDGTPATNTQTGDESEPGSETTTDSRSSTETAQSTTPGEVTSTLTETETTHAGETATVARTGTTSSRVPGFGVVATLAAAVVYVASRYRRR